MSTQKKQPPLPVGIKTRTLAFRAWHIPTAKMWKVGMFSDYHVFRAWDDSLSDEENYKVVDVHMLREECILMQLTEFVDQFGKPLYEGDILRVDNVLSQAELEEPDPQDDMPEYSYHEYIGWHNGAFGLVNVGETIADQLPYFSYWLSEFDHRLHGTLVGNLFEHPKIAAQTGCFALHPDHIRDYDEHTSDQ